MAAQAPVRHRSAVAWLAIALLAAFAIGSSTTSMVVLWHRPMLRCGDVDLRFDYFLHQSQREALTRCMQDGDRPSAAPGVIGRSILFSLGFWAGAGGAVLVWWFTRSEQEAAPTTSAVPYQPGATWMQPPGAPFVCPRCSAPNRTGTRFCTRCGAPFMS